MFCGFLNITDRKCGSRKIIKCTILELKHNLCALIKCENFFSAFTKEAAFSVLVDFINSSNSVCIWLSPLKMCRAFRRTHTYPWLVWELNNKQPWNEWKKESMLTALHLISLLLMCLYDKTGFLLLNSKVSTHIAVRLVQNQTLISWSIFGVKCSEINLKTYCAKPQNAFSSNANVRHCVLSFSTRISFKQISFTYFVKRNEMA